MGLRQDLQTFPLGAHFEILRMHLFDEKKVSSRWFFVTRGEEVRKVVFFKTFLTVVTFVSIKL